MARKKLKPKKSVSWIKQELLSITAVIISVGTLLVFLYQTNLVRKQQYMSVLPYLEFEHHAVFSDDYELILRNKGIGPALITSRNVVIKGQKYDLDVGRYLQEHIAVKDSVNFLISNVSRGNLISEKEGISMVDLEPNSSRSGLEKFYSLLYNDTLEFVVEYESVYGERWQVSTKETAPKKIKNR